MNVKKILELIEADPSLANDAPALVAMLNSKGSKKRRPIYKIVGYTNLPTSVSDEHGGEATLEDAESAIALHEKKNKEKKK